MRDEIEIEYRGFCFHVEFEMVGERHMGETVYYPEDMTLHHVGGKRWATAEKLVSARKDWDVIADRVREAAF